MKCPFCGFENLSGEDECETCHEDLSSLDGLKPKHKIEKGLMEDPISRIGYREPLLVGPETTVLEAVRKMNAAHVGCVLVQKNNGIGGILTERDILFKLLGQKKDLSKVTVNEVMTANVQSLSEDDTLAFAVNRMSVAGFRHIPIARGGKPVGILSVRNVLKYLSRLFP